MAFTPRTWFDNQTGNTAIDAANMNRIENGIATLDTTVVKTTDITPATDVVTTASLTTTLAGYAKIGSGGAITRQDLLDVGARLQALEAAANISNARPVRPPTQPAFWLRGDQINASGSTINGWTDNAGNLTYSIPSGKAAPTYNATGVRGKPAAVFTKSGNSALYFPKPLKADNATILVVFNLPALGSGQAFVQATDNTGAIQNLNINTYLSSGNAVVAGMQGNTNGNAFSATTISATGANIARMGYSAGTGSVTRNLYASLNGGTETGGTANTQAFTPATSTGLTIGGGADLSIAEVIVFDVLLSAAERAAWTQYLASTYGITVGAN